MNLHIYWQGQMTKNIYKIFDINNYSTKLPFYVKMYFNHALAAEPATF